MTGLNGTDLTALPAAEKRLRAREMAAADRTLTGADLDRLFGMKDRWGRKQAAAARTGTPAGPVREAGTPERPTAPVRTAPSNRNVSVERNAVPERPPRPSVPAPAGTDPQAVPLAVVRVTTASVIAVAVVAAAASFEHMVRLAETVGEPRPWLLPISVDGLVVAASMALLVQRRAGRPGSWLAKGALTLGLGASLAANVVAVDPTMVDPAVVRRLVAAWPPCSLAISYELLLGLRTHTSPTGPIPRKDTTT